MARLVLTIHGINSDGEWQDRIARVLEPHFECQPIRYDEYRRWGFTKALLGIRRKTRTRKRVHDQYESHTYGRLLPPHLIAHSFGTVLSAALMKHPLVRFDRIIFAGSALSARTNWQPLLDDDEKFCQLRNETGEKDLVVRLAGLAQFLRPGLGNAGVIGFVGKGVHRLPGPKSRCAECGASRARIHNAPLREYGHSDHFLKERHAAELWLPFLFGHSPDEYASFLERCGQAELYEESGQHAELVETEEVLHRFRLRWLETSPERIELSDYVLSQLRCFPGAGTPLDDAEKYVATVIRGVWKSVAAAVRERGKPPSSRDNQKLLALRPRIAVVRAVTELLKTIGRR